MIDSMIDSMIDEFSSPNSFPLVRLNMQVREKIAVIEPYQGASWGFGIFHRTLAAGLTVRVPS